jgi:hypothetical protein
MPTIDDKGFYCNPVAPVDRSLGLLINIPSGERDAIGESPEGSINRRARARPIDLTERQQDPCHLQRRRTEMVTRVLER